MTEHSLHRPARPDQLAVGFAVENLAKFDTIIDVRSPDEYAEDRVPSARNHPVLSNEERSRVGSLHKQASAFEAKKLGAVLVARNIANHIDQHFSSKPKDWRPLVYCWRGGSRSGAMTHILRAIGWQAAQLEGGYKAFRALVRRDLDTLPLKLTFKVVCGRTGSGKSRLLVALREAGAQVLDLEEMAAHRGSVLGELPNAPQPSQKSFETALWDALNRLDATRPVWVEAESKRVGLLRVPDTLMDRMRDGQCVLMDTAPAERVALLQADYRHLMQDVPLLWQKLDCLQDLHSDMRINDWKALAERGEWDALVEALLAHHYDPAYTKSMYRNYRHIGDAMPLPVHDASPAGLGRLAKALADQLAFR